MKHRMAHDWIVWGDGADKLFTGPEDEAKYFIVNSPLRDSLYLEAPDGREFEEDRSTGEWREIV